MNKCLKKISDELRVDFQTKYNSIISSNVQTACSTDSLNNCPKHSILKCEFCAENLLMIENVSTQLTVFHCLCPLPASRKGLRLPLRSALFGEGGSDWRP